MTALTNDATGYLEVTGYVAALLASDAMAKAARVDLAAVHKPGGGLVCIHARGPLADCQAAIAAGTAVARELGALAGSLVIGRPAEDTADIWSRHIPDMTRRKKTRNKTSGQPWRDAATGDGSETVSASPDNKTGKKRAKARNTGKTGNKGGSA